MLQYAEAIIDYLTDIKPGDRSRALLDRNEALLKLEPYCVMEAFEKNVEKIGQRSLNAIVTISNKLKEALE